MVIKILGMSCPNCRRLEGNAKEAVKQLGIKAEIEKISEPKEIMALGIMSTPAIIADDKVLFYGRVPSAEEIMKALSK